MRNSTHTQMLKRPRRFCERTDGRRPAAVFPESSSTGRSGELVRNACRPPAYIRHVRPGAAGEIAQILTSVFQVTGCGIVDQLPVLGEAGAVTGTVPGVFRGIPLQRAAQMGTAFGGGRQQVGHSFKPIDDQLGMKDGTGGGEYLLVRVFLSMPSTSAAFLRAMT